jgi:hypothetical protein
MVSHAAGYATLKNSPVWKVRGSFQTGADCVESDNAGQHGIIGHRSRIVWFGKVLVVLPFC